MPEVFEPGSGAPSSGVYNVIHARQHAQPHYVTALYGDTLPPCQECSIKVRFELAMPAVHVNAHPLFTRGQNK
jgi:hypothetical protein